jgi:hypothetical protein
MSTIRSSIEPHPARWVGIRNLIFNAIAAPETVVR